jgi:hypothetical protein
MAGFKTWGMTYGKPKQEKHGGGTSTKSPSAAEDHSGKSKAESEHSKIAGEQAKGKGEDIHGVVATHGPAHHMEMEKHPEGGFSIKTTHGENEHVHEHRAEQFDEAASHAKAAFGEENPDQFEEAENEGAHGEKFNIGGLGNMGSMVTGLNS